MGGDWGPWSETVCTQATIPSTFDCSFWEVDEIDPGIVDHYMTYLEEKDVVVVTGGASREGKDPDEVLTEANNRVFIYNMDYNQLEPIGDLSTPNDCFYFRRVAIPLDSNSILVTGVRNDYCNYPDAVCTH